MSMHWCWSWGVGLANADYNTGSPGWVLGAASATPNSTTNPPTAAPGGGTPPETHVLQTGSTTITCPAFPDGAVSQGWVVFRWNGNGQTLSASAAIRIIDLMSGAATVRVTLRATLGLTSTPLTLLVNGTVIGTTTDYYGASWSTFAIDFDLTTTPPQAGLVVGGRREIVRAAGSGTPTTIDRIRWAGGTGSAGAQCLHGGLVLFNSLADLTDRETQDVWVSYLSPDAVTDPDASWTPTTTTDLGDVSDKVSATGVTSTTDPDDFSAEFPTFNAYHTGWAPTIVYGVAALSYNIADAAINQHTIELFDAGGSVKSSGVTTGSTVGEFLGVWSALASDAAPWDPADVETALSTITVST